MSEPVRYCPACYEPNSWNEVRCIACDITLQTDESYDERLIWALGHPDTATATLAAELLARRNTREAIDRLIELVDSVDPYRAAAAAHALTTFDDDRARATVKACLEHPSALVRRAVAG